MQPYGVMVPQPQRTPILYSHPKEQKLAKKIDEIERLRSTLRGEADS